MAPSPKVTHRDWAAETSRCFSVSIANRGPVVAFMLRVDVLSSPSTVTDNRVLPFSISDNYLVLLPQEATTVLGCLPCGSSRPRGVPCVSSLYIRTRAWNSFAATVEVMP